MMELSQLLLFDSSWWHLKGHMFTFTLVSEFFFWNLSFALDSPLYNSYNSKTRLEPIWSVVFLTLTQLILLIWIGHVKNIIKEMESLGHFLYTEWIGNHSRENKYLSRNMKTNFIPSSFACKFGSQWYRLLVHWFASSLSAQINPRVRCAVGSSSC